MIIKTFDELRQADERTLRFTPMALGLGVQMRPEDAAEYQQIEQALRDRFAELHQGTVTFVDDAGVDHPIAVSRYEQVQEFLRNHRP